MLTHFLVQHSFVKKRFSPSTGAVCLFWDTFLQKSLVTIRYDNGYNWTLFSDPFAHPTFHQSARALLTRILCLHRRSHNTDHLKWWSHFLKCDSRWKPGIWNNPIKAPISVLENELRVEQHQGYRPDGDETANIGQMLLVLQMERRRSLGISL